MGTIRIETEIAAPPERCFDLARSVDAHIESARRTRERAVGGKMQGLLSLGDQVTWRARHFAVTQELTSRMTQFDRPVHFQDVMVRGAFTSLVHDHSFVATDAGTRMVDLVVYRAPLGPLGRLAEIAFLTAYLRRFLVERGQCLKGLAEGDAWRRFLPPA